jgi:hypothetical protein
MSAQSLICACACKVCVCALYMSQVNVCECVYLVPVCECVYLGGPCRSLELQKLPNLVIWLNIAGLDRNCFLIHIHLGQILTRQRALSTVRNFSTVSTLA